MRSISKSALRTSLFTSIAAMGLGLLTGCGGGESKKTEESATTPNSVASFAAAYHDTSNNKLGVINAKGQEVLQASDVVEAELREGVLLYSTQDPATGIKTTYFLGKDLKNIIPPVQNVPSFRVTSGFIAYTVPSGVYIYTLAGQPILEGEKLTGGELSDQWVAYVRRGSNELIVKDTHGTLVASHPVNRPSRVKVVGNLVSFVRPDGQTVVYNEKNELKLGPIALAAGDDLHLTEDAIYLAQATPAGTHHLAIHDSSGTHLRTLADFSVADSIIKGNLIATYVAGAGFSVQTIQGNPVLAPTPLDFAESYKSSKNLFAFVQADKTFSVGNAAGSVVYSAPEIKFEAGAYSYGISPHYGWHKSLGDDYVIFNETGKVLKTINHPDLTIYLAE